MPKRIRFPWRRRRKNNYGAIEDALPNRDSSTTDITSQASSTSPSRTILVVGAITVGWILGYLVPLTYSIAALVALILIYLAYKLYEGWPRSIAEFDEETPLLRSGPKSPLDPFYIIDAFSGERAPVNRMNELHVLDNEYFRGTMLVMLKTDDMSREIKEHMGNKQRRFEFQFQIKLKKVPPGKVYFACQLRKAISLGIVQRALVSAAMTFIKSKNKDFRYDLGAQPYMAFPIEQGMNKVIRTPPSQVPPPLGGNLPESNVKEFQWNLSDTYTMALWSAYVDFLDWKCLNLPGIRPFGLTSVIQRQPIHMTVYFEDRDPIVDLEVSNSDHSDLGACANKYVRDHGLQTMYHVKSNEELEEEALAELGEGLYVYSGQKIALQDSVSHFHLANGGGFAVMQETSTSHIVMEHAEGYSKLFRNGDNVVIKHCLTSEIGRTEIRYLSIHRGWWLKWVKAAPKRNGYFTLIFQEDEEAKLPFLTLGKHFDLRHKRWSKFDVGISSEISSTYGGRLLGLYRKTDGVLQKNEDGPFSGDTWMESVSFRALEFTIDSPLRTRTLSKEYLLDKLDASTEDHGFASSRVDVPAWIEVFNRSERATHLVYCIRVRNPDGECHSYLRNGSEMSPILRLAVKQEAQNSSNIESSPYVDKEITTSTSRPEEPMSRRPSGSSTRHVIGNILRGTKNTGKKVVEGTVSASKAVVPRRRPTKPPRKEPKSKQSSPKKSQEERRFGASTKGSIENIASSMDEYSSKWQNINGELSGPEKSRMMVTRVLSYMHHSNGADVSSQRSTFSRALLENLSVDGLYDMQFLSGGAVEFGIDPEQRNLVKGAVVCHCIWESHWCEKWLGIYSDSIRIWKPQTSSSDMELSFEEILDVRMFIVTDEFPLQGYSGIVVDTVWACHHFVFVSQEVASDFCTSIKSLVENRKVKKLVSSVVESQDVIFWRGATILAGSEEDRSRWGSVQSGNKRKRRIILNSRKAVFDLDRNTVVDAPFVEGLFKRALSFDAETLPAKVSAFVEFQNAVAHLKLIDFARLDFQSSASYCMFLNLYHCLLQHSLLLTLKSKLHKGSCMHFMRTMSYEIGNDVFSLCELKDVLLRGNLTHAGAGKPPFIQSPSSNQPSPYALGYATPTTNFAISTGDVTFPGTIRIFRSETLDKQITSCAIDYIRRNVKIEGEKLLLIPRIFQAYSHDFGGDSNSARTFLDYIVPFLEKSLALYVREGMERDGNLSVKFLPLPEVYHTRLDLAEE